MTTRGEDAARKGCARVRLNLGPPTDKEPYLAKTASLGEPARSLFQFLPPPPCHLVMLTWMTRDALPWFPYCHGSCPEAKTDSREQHPPSDPRHNRPPRKWT